MRHLDLVGKKTVKKSYYSNKRKPETEKQVENIMIYIF